eukprot:gnl/TRDRNA2_/TRDRNA2_169044_c0_seq2.p1 gnl/TRDRNA2_/TRDRNA2_169044_c0~~gnl/TRDRNA2_/TRDRNA2_169044_c0_seq2.p1  ORF type:complete len:531 (-),score=102.60 gnl/TRDRNA2_/TRDRNA2_169044_c0_seq2:30-1622(-)
MYMDLGTTQLSPAQRKKNAPALQRKKTMNHPGDHDSASFFSKMEKSFADNERVKQQAALARENSTARLKPEKVSMDNVYYSVQTAQESSFFSSTARIKDNDGLARQDTGAPLWLGHLSMIGRPTTTDETDGGEVYDVTLPGAVSNDPSRQPSRRESQVQEQEKEIFRRPSKDRRQSKERKEKSPSPEKDKRGSSRTSSKDIQEAPADRQLPDPIITDDTDGGISADATRSPPNKDFKSESEDATPGGLGSGLTSDASNDEGEESESELFSSSELYEDDDERVIRPPIAKFKTQTQFSARFKREFDELRCKKEGTEYEGDVDIAIHGKAVPVKDPTLAYLNAAFDMQIDTVFYFDVGFPLMFLTMMDAVYPKRVRWHEVDFRFQYKRALHKNFALLEYLWSDLHMLQCREFRPETTSLRLDAMLTASHKDKMDFLRLMKRWYDSRRHLGGPYDAMVKRYEFLQSCKHMGISVHFPPFIKYNEEEAKARAAKAREAVMSREAETHSSRTEYKKMPEFKRLIYFLGSPDYGTM